MNKTTLTCRESDFLQEKYYRIAHKSGLEIYVIPKKMTTAYAIFGTRYGSRDNCFRLSGEAEYLQVPEGIAHFLEHKLFENEDGVDTFERFARLGASANAFTSTGVTAYEFSCTENFEEALTILLHSVTHPYFTDANVEKEQGIIAQEIRGGEDNPRRCLYYDVLRLLYQKDSLRIEVAGTVESISRITPEHLYRCYRTFYQLSNMALVVCGDVDCETVIRVADKVLEEKEEKEIERYFEAEPKETAGKTHRREMSISRPLFGIGFKDMTPSEPVERLRRATLMGLLSDLFFGVSSSFYNDLYNEGLINHTFGASYESYQSTGFFLISGECAEPDEVYRRIMAHLELLRENPPPREDFERLCRAVYADYIRAFDSTDECANEFLEHLFAGIDFFDVGEMIASVTYDEALALLAQGFTEESAVMATVYPKNEGENENGNQN